MDSNLKETVTHDLVMLWFLMGQHRGAGRRIGSENRAPLDPTRGRGRIIALLKIKDGLSAKELACVLGIRVSSLNEMLAKMEKDGLISRKPSDADKRIILIYLTEAGCEVEVDECKEVDFLAGFSDEELEQLSIFLSRMLKNMESELGEDYMTEMYAQWNARAHFMRANGAFSHGPFPFGSIAGNVDPRVGMNRGIGGFGPGRNRGPLPGGVDPHAWMGR